MRVRLRNPDRVEEVPGPCTVGEVLEALDVNPTTVLVIHEGQLVPAGTTLDDDAEIEVRPVISGGSADRCIDCGGAVVIEEPRHRAAWCAVHFRDHVVRQVRKAIDAPMTAAWVDEPGRMFSYDDRILVAVSGGKDSLALWHILLEMGYAVDGLCIGLGIGGYSARSTRVCREFAATHAAPRGRRLIEVDLAQDHGYSIPGAAKTANRPSCAICGLSKRWVFNQVAVEHGHDVLATGHNLDDEAATLFGNVVRWQDEFLARQRPVLPARGRNQVRKVKPLYRLSEREMAAYCVVAGIDYVVEECPLVAGNTGIEHKDALSELERATPGIKAQFLFSFLDREAGRWATDDGRDDVGECTSCGMPTTAPVCAFCRQRERLAGHLPVATT